MNITLITPYFPDEHTIDSGIASHYQLLAQSLAARGNNIVVMHVRGQYENEHDAFSKHSPAPNITVLTFKVRVPALVHRLFKRRWAVIDLALKLRCMLVTAGTLNKILKQYNIDVVETSSYFSLCYFALRKRVKAPVTVRVSTTLSQMMTAHYPFKSRGMNLIAALEIALIKKSRHLITHARSHAQELERLYAIDSAHFTIIPHGVNLPGLQEESYNNGAAIKILYTGRLEYRKGTDVLMAAIPLVLQECPDVLFELIGNDPGNEYQTGFEQGNQNALLKKVFFKGKIANDALAEAYQNCDIFVAPSRYESFGIIFIEAMSYGKPVIGCPVGGVPDIITENYNGLFADTGNAQSLADKILLLATNKHLRKEMGLNARKTVEDKFTAEQLAANSLNYYQTLLK
ncbi:glycosyltransferase family 4 protein [Mucilaginibacter sp.]